ncbi:MAG: hypothetical protein ABSA85_04315 [Terracidiphilus sp.]
MTEQAAAAARSRMLIAIKALHTAVWVVQGGSIVSLPFLAWRGAFRWVGIATAVVVLHGVVLRLNGRRCPLTDLAARYTTDRRPNFDAYVPAWLAQHNRAVFIPLFLANEALVFAFWLAWPPLRAM